MLIIYWKKRIRELDKCLSCTQLALNLELYIKFNDNYYPTKNDSLNIGKYINYYFINPEGYYID